MWVPADTTHLVFKGLIQSIGDAGFPWIKAPRLSEPCLRTAPIVTGFLAALLQCPEWDLSDPSVERSAAEIVISLPAGRPVTTSGGLHTKAPSVLDLPA